MDQRDDEQPERTQPAQPASPWVEPEATLPLTRESAEVAGTEHTEEVPQPYGYPAPPAQAQAQAPAPATTGSPGDYPPGGYTSGGYGPGGYGPGGYGPGGYGPGGDWPGGYWPGGGEPAGPERPRRSRKAAALIVAALVLLSAAAGAGVAYAVRQNKGGSVGLATSPAGKSMTTPQIDAAVGPAVVEIDTNLGEGTGMIATSKGEIITNNHVVEGASSIKVVTLKRGTFTATVVGTDARDDVAVLQLSGVSGLPTVKFGNSSRVQIGNFVVAIGNALGMGPQATAGAVTALNRSITASDEAGVDESLTGMIEMDARIEPGNSGGPLIDSSGEVIGMNTAAASGDGSDATIGFALPINRVLKIANDIEHGKSGNGVEIGSEAFLGIAGATVTLHGSGPKSGAGLEYVSAGTPAARAGLAAGDVIVAFDGHATPSINELATLIHKERPGDRATVTFENPAGSTQTVTVTLAAAPPA